MLKKNAIEALMLIGIFLWEKIGVAINKAPNLKKSKIKPTIYDSLNILAQSMNFYFKTFNSLFSNL